MKTTDSEDTEFIEVPSKDDGTCSVTTVTSQYPGATGLRYQLDGHLRAVEMANDRFHPPSAGWSNLIYYCVFPKSKSIPVSSWIIDNLIENYEC